MSEIREDLRYTASHEWVRVEGNLAVVGITDHAQAELTDVVYIELPGEGQTVAREQACAVVESTKVASDVYTPVSGTVVAANEALAADPGLINRSPYEGGWLFQVEMSSPKEIETLLSAAEYRSAVGE